MTDIMEDLAIEEKKPSENAEEESTDQESLYCTVCYETKPMEPLPCGHSFCKQVKILLQATFQKRTQKKKFLFSKINFFVENYFQFN